MSAKRSPAARIIEFFSTQPIGEAELVYGLVREIVRKRRSEGTTATPVPVRKRTTRRVKAKAPDTTPQGAIKGATSGTGGTVTITHPVMAPSVV